MMDFINKKLKALIPAGIFTVCYMVSFLVLEEWDRSTYICTSLKIDQYIPFVPAFIIPYLFWFVFIVGGFAYLLFFDEEKLNWAYYYLFSGMAICIVIYFICPTKQDLRVSLDQTKFFQSLIGYIYSVDTSTNVCPSIHVYNSLMMSYVLNRTRFVNRNKVYKVLNVLICLSICLSTVFVKQHAFIDGVFACALAIIVWLAGKYIFHIEE